MSNRVETIKFINSLVKNNTPFLFIISFEGENNRVFPLSQLKNNNTFYKTPGLNNLEIKPLRSNLLSFEKEPISFLQYQSLFNKVISEIKKGNSFLLNLTVPTRINSNLNLYELFVLAEAKYKLYCNDEFALFSPESFISIEDNIIKTFPMKGTIRADIPNALEIILNDTKEAAEHATIVDLLRNDLSIVASNVHVTRYRYADVVQTNFGPIYQISSEIQGELPHDFKDNFGEMLFSLLPAGSICGAPKNKTVNIIKDVEMVPRGYYTGVFGVWDTKKLESAVMIRFVRNDKGELWYHSGGGITFQSDCWSEYEELIDKVQERCIFRKKRGLTWTKY